MPQSILRILMMTTLIITSSNIFAYSTHQSKTGKLSRANHGKRTRRPSDPRTKEPKRASKAATKRLISQQIEEEWSIFESATPAQPYLTQPYYAEITGDECIVPQTVFDTEEESSKANIECIEDAIPDTSTDPLEHQLIDDEQLEEDSHIFVPMDKKSKKIWRLHQQQKHRLRTQQSKDPYAIKRRLRILTTYSHLSKKEQRERVQLTRRLYQTTYVQPKVGEPKPIETAAIHARGAKASKKDNRIRRNTQNPLRSAQLRKGPICYHPRIKKLAQAQPPRIGY